MHHIWLDGCLWLTTAAEIFYILMHSEFRSDLQMRSSHATLWKWMTFSPFPIICETFKNQRSRRCLSETVEVQLLRHYRNRGSSRNSQSCSSHAQPTVNNISPELRVKTVPPTHSRLILSWLISRSLSFIDSLTSLSSWFQCEMLWILH